MTRQEYDLLLAVLNTLVLEVRYTRALTLAGLESLGRQNTKEEKRIMKNIEQIKAELEAGLARSAAAIAEQTTVVGGVETLVQGEVAAIAAMKQQIADLIAGGADASVLDPVVAMLGEHQAQLAANTARLTAAVVQGTPADAARETRQGF